MQNAAHRVIGRGVNAGTFTLPAPIVDVIPIEAAHVMGPDDSAEPPVYEDFRRLLPGLELQRIGRFEFYDMARGPDTALAIATGEQRIYANILLTIGVVMPE